MPRTQKTLRNQPSIVAAGFVGATTDDILHGRYDPRTMTKHRALSKDRRPSSQLAPATHRALAVRLRRIRDLAFDLRRELERTGAIGAGDMAAAIGIEAAAALHVLASTQPVAS